MSEPTRMMTVEDATLADGTSIPRWTPVWTFGDGDEGITTVDWRGRRSTLPSDLLTATPVLPPHPDQLTRLDPCVAEIVAGRWPLTERLQDQRMFVWYRCPHGAWYLRETRGGIALYEKLIFVGMLPGEPDDYELAARWRDWHTLPDDALNYLRVALPLPKGGPNDK